MPNDILSNVWPEWHVVKLLGKGSYGSVYEAERTDASVKSRAAVKVITIPQTETEISTLMSEGMTVDNARDYYRGLVDAFINEIRIMESLKGVQNIVSVEDYKVIEIKDRLAWNIFIRMELLTPFNDYIISHPLDEAGVIDLGIDICTALERCARLNIIHRDIKPENIFVNSFGDFKLGDFGIARRLENATGAMSFKGTYNYMAPEIANGYDYDASVDTYSLGLVLFRMVNDNRLPFLAAADQMNPNARVEAVRRRLSGELLPMPENCSLELFQIIDMACQPDPKDRFTSASAMKNSLIYLKNSKAGQQVRPVSAQIPPVQPVRQSTPTAPVSSGGPYNSRVTYNTPAAPAQAPVSENKKKSSLAIVIVAIAAAVVAIVVAAILIIPELTGDVSQTEATTATRTAASYSAATETATETASAAAETEAAATEVATESATTAAGIVTAATDNGKNTAAETSTTAAPVVSYKVGDIISFGYYEQDGNTSDGKEKIQWQVLNVSDDQMLVISRFGLDSQQFDSSGKKLVTWENCTLRTWLNNSFLNSAFGAEDQTLIQTSYVPAARNSKYPEKSPGNDTYDKIFVLSTAEAEYYFGSDAARKMQPTTYAIAQGVTYCNNKDNQGYGYWWWLRDPGRDDDYAALVFPEGKVDYVGYHYNDTENAVRPAMWISTSGNYSE